MLVNAPVLKQVNGSVQCTAAATHRQLFGFGHLAPSLRLEVESGASHHEVIELKTADHVNSRMIYIDKRRNGTSYWCIFNSLQ